MSYRVKEIFSTIQGEGANLGRRAVFCRFAGCNGWSGKEADRDKGALGCAAWCDTDFVGGEKMSAVAIAQRAVDLWGADRAWRWIVLTGGEPALQVDSLLLDTLHRFGFFVQIETNGTKVLPPGIEYITVSPKVGGTVVLDHSDEVKIVYPQEIDPERFGPDRFPATHHILQPKDGPDREASLLACIDYICAHPWWRLGIQAHKTWRLP